MVQEYEHFFKNPEMINKILANKIVKNNIHSDINAFYINIDKETCAYINTELGINIGTKVPMRITSKDIDEHADVRLGTKESDDTYIIYISDPGDTKLILDGQEYPLHKNTAFKFGPNVLHSTVNTNSSRIMMGPFNGNGVVMGAEMPTSMESPPQQKTPKGVVYCGGCTNEHFALDTDLSDLVHVMRTLT